MIISHKYKFIFIKTRKTAGTSIEVYLSQFCGEEDVVTPIFPYVPPHSPKNYKGFFNPIPELMEKNRQGIKDIMARTLKRERFYNHMAAKIIKERISDDIWNQYFKFCVERNPWDKTLSHYHMVKDRVNKNMTFDDYFQRNEFCHNSHIYTDTQGNILADKILKYENLDAELDEVFKKLGVPFEGTLKVKAKGNHRKERKKYQDVYTEEQKEQIADIFKKEIQMHGYNF